MKRVNDQLKLGPLTGVHAQNKEARVAFNQMAELFESHNLDIEIKLF